MYDRTVLHENARAPIPKPRLERRRPNSRIDNELVEAIKRTRYSVEGFGPSSTEILKVAALQVIQAKLDEIGQLLNAIVPGLRIEVDPVNFAGNTRSPLTLENIDRLDKQAQRHVSTNGETCQICGYPAVYKTKRGMTLCVTHRAQGIKDDQDEKLSAMMAQGFGSHAGSVIRMDDAAVKAELAEGGEGA